MELSLEAVVKGGRMLRPALSMVQTNPFGLNTIHRCTELQRNR